RKICAKDLDATRIKCSKPLLTLDQMERGSFLGPGFSQQQSARGKVESGQPKLSRDLRVFGAPAKTTSDHHMEDQKEFAFQAEYDTFAQAAQFNHFLSFGFLDGRIKRSNQKRAGQSDLFQPLVQYSVLQSLNIDDSISQFGH